jgi:hypothetical protein
VKQLSTIVMDRRRYAYRLLPCGALVFTPLPPEPLPALPVSFVWFEADDPELVLPPLLPDEEPPTLDVPLAEPPLPPPFIPPVPLAPDGVPVPLAPEPRSPPLNVPRLTAPSSCFFGAGRPVTLEPGPLVDPDD